MLFRGVARPHLLDLPSPNPVDSPIGKICFSLLPQNNRSIRAFFKGILYQFLMSQVTGIHWSLISVGEKSGYYHICLLVNKVKEVSFRMIHKYYPANHYLKKIKKDIDCTLIVLFVLSIQKQFCIYFAIVYM